MKECLITGLMPLKNYHGDFLKRAIGSVKSQTCPDWRLLIIVEKRDLRKFQKMLSPEPIDFRMEIIVNQGRKLAGAINTGMKHANTQFVAILLADDLWANHAIEVLSDRIRRYPEVDFFHSARRRIDANGNPVGPVHPPQKDVSAECFKRSSPVKHILCWRRNKGLAVGGLDETLNSVGPDDYDFPWTMAETGARFQALEECLYYYRVHLECFRLTTHLPLSVHKHEIARIFRKHGVDEATIRDKIARAEETYLKQCLYRSKLDLWLKHLIGIDPRKGREDYGQFILKHDSPENRKTSE
jgi:glycosyltransferase involved in cell wall biosynthesis